MSIHTCRAVPLPCCLESEFSRALRSMARGGAALLVRTEMGDLQEDPRFGLFRLPREFPRRLLPENFSVTNELEPVSTKLNYVYNGWREVDSFGSKAWVLVQFTAEGLWQRSGQRQVSEGESWRCSWKVRNMPHNILFVIKRLIDIMRLSVTTEIM